MVENKQLPRRHRLLVYYRLGQRRRTAPLLIAIMGGILYGLGWLASRSILQAGSAALLDMLWQRRAFILVLIIASFALYALMLVIARSSYVEARPGALHIRAGLVPLDISYGRIRQIRLAQVGAQYPLGTLKGGDYALLEPFIEKPCTAIDLRSWPKLPVKKLWHRLMFSGDGGSLLLIVQDAMVLNQQIDGALATRQARRKKRIAYQDPIERAVEMSRRQLR